MPTRPPFDPSRVQVGGTGVSPVGATGETPVPPNKAPPDKTPRADETLLSVRHVNEMVRVAVEAKLPATLHVVGEIGNLSRPASGHLYFTLKDESSELRAVMWRSAAATLRFAPEVGMAVVATGGIEVYAPRGTYQLLVRRLEPRGVGALEVAFRQLKEKLAREGLFDAARKRPLPRVPERIAVVTSPSGAAVRDILQTLARRFPAAEVLLFPVRVQGEGAAAEIAAAINALSTHAEALGGIDVAIVGRGGGSLEDLWAFNEEVVARAVTASRVPIVSGVGHETDFTICDLVADVRAATPTAAAELVAPPAAVLRETVVGQVRRASRTLRHRLDLARAELATLLATESLDRPLRRLHERAQLVDELTQRLMQGLVERGHAAREQLSRATLALWRFGAGAALARQQTRLAERLRRVQRAHDGLARRAERGLLQRVDRLRLVGPPRRLERLDSQLRLCAQRLHAAVRRRAAEAGALLAARVAAAQACDPRSVLRRGYSITRDARTRAVLRSVRDVHEAQRLVTELPDGEVRSTADDPRQPRLFE